MVAERAWSRRSLCGKSVPSRKRSEEFAETASADERGAKTAWRQPVGAGNTDRLTPRRLCAGCYLGAGGFSPFAPRPVGSFPAFGGGPIVPITLLGSDVSTGPVWGAFFSHPRPARNTQATRRVKHFFIGV